MASFNYPRLNTEAVLLPISWGFRIRLMHCTYCAKRPPGHRKSNCFPNFNSQDLSNPAQIRVVICGENGFKKVGKLSRVLACPRVRGLPPMERQCWQKELPGEVTFGHWSGQGGHVGLDGDDGEFSISHSTTTPARGRICFSWWNLFSEARSKSRASINCCSTRERAENESSEKDENASSVKPNA